MGFENYSHNPQQLHDKLVKLKDRVMRKLTAVSKLKATASKEGAEKDPRMQNVRRVCVCVCVCVCV